MNNYRNSNRKGRFKSNGDRNYRKRSSNGHKSHGDLNSTSEFRYRNAGRNNQNAAKLVDKYNNLAREALSSGDKILSENYFQHADHFTRILKEKEFQKKSLEDKSSKETNNIFPEKKHKEDESLSQGKDLKNNKIETKVS